MNRKEKIIFNDIINGENMYYKNLSVDNVIFGYHDRELKVLLLKPTGSIKWLLPGGYVKKKETLEQAAERIVRYRTNLKKMLMHQFRAFSDPERNKDIFFNHNNLESIFKMEVTKDHWLLDDFVTIAFFSLTEYSLVRPKGDFYAEECEWFDINNLPDLSFDHSDIVKVALQSLKIFTYHYPIGYDLLPEKFTIPELQSLYETILNKKIDNRNFTKKILSLGLIQKLDEKKKIGGHRSPYLYKFDKERYKDLLKNEEIIIF